MILNHSLASSVSHYESISKVDGHLTANALAMKFLYDVSRGSNTCQDILFSGNPSMTYGNSTIAKLIGWKFNHVGYETGFICNFSSDSFDVSLGSNFTHSLQYDQYAADPKLVVNGISSLTKTYGISSDVITIAPYSITQIKSDNPLSLSENRILKNNIIIRSLSKTKEIEIESALVLNNSEVLLFNLHGQLVLKQNKLIGNKITVAIPQISTGFYILKLQNGGETITKKIMID